MIKRKLKFGWIPDLPDERDIYLKLEQPKDFTRIHDIRWSGNMPPVRNQGNIGSCTGFGTGTAVWSAMLSDKTFITPAFHPSELFIYYNGRREKSEDTGASIRDVVKATIDFGVAPLQAWMYDTTKVLIKPTKEAYDQALKFKTIRYARVRQTREDICNVLASGYPIVFGHLCYTNFFSVKKDGIVPMPSGQIEGGHCEIICGYNLDKDNGLVQNSWGTSRGDRGYEHFSFEYLLDPDICMDFWVIYEISI